MSKRLSIDSLAAMYLDLEADLSDRDAVLDDVRCDACGAVVVETESELFPLACPACGHGVESGD